MKLMLKYMSPYSGKVTFTVVLKFAAVIVELCIPYILEYMIDDIAPSKHIDMVLIWGVVMIAAAFVVRMLNVYGNRLATATARDTIRNLRYDIFYKTMYLSGAKFDEISLPSLISRITSDSYNVQNFIGMVQRMGVRAPILLVGGIVVAAIMDPVLSLILAGMVPILGSIVLFVSYKGIPMFRKAQEYIDQIVRVMRENITGIRVIKALSKCGYEREHFNKVNDVYTKQDIKAGLAMALPNPVMKLFLNIGLTLIVIIGAYRVNAGHMKPGVILAFLTYINMILQAIMGINRIFIQYSKAGASADRIASILNLNDNVLKINKLYKKEDKASNYYAVEFNNVCFSYPVQTNTDDESPEFAGGEREYSLNDISFKIKKGESLGIIGSTGCGKTTIVNLIMRFYDITDGEVKLNGNNVKGMNLQELRSHIGVVFQNDTIFNDTLSENIKFGRDISDKEMREAAGMAGLLEFIESLKGAFDYKAAIKGMNLSGGQRQRLLIARALASNPELLIFDDSSSALDYKTDSMLRKNIENNYKDCTMLMIAQRVSSVKNMTNILVMDEGRMIGYGTHDMLMKSCEVYRDIYESQMGELH